MGGSAPNKKAPREGRLSTGCGGHFLTPRTTGRVSVVNAWPALCLTGEEKGSRLWERRCSKLDLLGCDPGSGYATQDLRTRESEMAYRSLRLRDGVRAAPSSSPVVRRIVGVPPLGEPASEMLLGQILTYLIFFVIAWGWIFWRFDWEGKDRPGTVIEISDKGDFLGTFDFYGAFLMPWCDVAGQRFPASPAPARCLLPFTPSWFST